MYSFTRFSTSTHERQDAERHQECRQHDERHGEAVDTELEADLRPKAMRAPRSTGNLRVRRIELPPQATTETRKVMTVVQSAIAAACSSCDASLPPGTMQECRARR